MKDGVGTLGVVEGCKDVAELTVSERRKILCDGIAGNIDKYLMFSYNKLLFSLISEFPQIPKDLKNSRVIIKYEQENGVSRNLYIFDDGILLPNIDGKDIRMGKNEDSWSFSVEYVNGKETNKEKLSISEFMDLFTDLINQFVENSDKCDVIVEKIDASMLESFS